MSKVYANGQKDFTVASAGRLSVLSDSVCSIYQEVGYPNFPSSWDLLATTVAGVQYVSATFSANTNVRIVAGPSDVIYKTGTLTEVGASSGSTISVVEYNEGFVHKTVLTFTATPVTVADDAGVAQYGGTGKVYDLPDGLISFLGCIVTGSLTMGATGTFIDAFTGLVSLGSIGASTGATLTATEADIMASVAVGAATTKVATIAGTSVGATVVNGTATAKDVYLNFLIADDATHTAGTGTFTGTVTMLWSNTGDIA